MESRSEPADEGAALTAAWLSVVEALRADSALTARQKGHLRLARPRAMVGAELIVIVTKNELTKQELEGALRTPLNREFERVLGFTGAFAFAVDPELEVDLDDTPSVPGSDEFPTDARQSSPGSAQAPVDEAPTAGPETRLIPSPGSAAAPGSAPVAQESDTGASESEGPRAAHTGSAGQQVDHRGGPQASGETLADLNPKYTFDTFVIGASNRFPSAAALAVAENPAKAFNPLFIYGDSGLGKTHLLHAIGHYAGLLYPGLRVKYVSSEEFVNDFINSIGNSTTSNQLRPAFQRRYREVDVLMIDDIQFLQGKDATVEEFFHTFNALHNEQKQVIITSDLPPKQLQGFEERLRSRFESGLLADVLPPDLETRIAILRRKAEAERLDVPGDVLEYIASRISSNIRELEGALIRVTAFANLNQQPVDLSIAQTVLKDFIIEEEAPAITASAIIMMTANYFNLSYDDLCGSSRSRTLTTARQIAMYLCRELTELSLPKIGQEFGGRDHTTVMHANKKIGTQLAERRAIYTQVTELTNRIKQQHKA